MTRLAERLEALGEAVEASAGRLPAEVVSRARAVVQRAGERVALSGERTVVALAGATGSGKSSLFNAISGTSLAQVTVRRPTTSKVMAVSWGTRLPHELLDWLDVPRRHLVPSGPDGFSSLVLLDLPDHDSTELGHRLAVDRLVQVVDALIWVVDPQKYADAALHERYLRPLAPYADLMLVVLNQSDRLAPADLEACVRDLRRLLDSDGLRSTPLMTASAVRGTGVPELRELLERTVTTKQAALRRLAADVTVAAEELSGELGRADPKPGRDTVSRLTDALAAAAGVPTVVEGVRKAWFRRGTARTGWPGVAWLSRLRPDPLRRLRLDLGVATGDQRTALPRAGAVPLAGVESAVRAFARQASAGLPEGWATAVSTASRLALPLLPDQLDAAVAATDLRMENSSWWTLTRVLQWLLLTAAIVGVGWLLAPAVAGLLGLPAVPLPTWNGVPVPTLLLLAGLVGGVLLALLGRALVGLAAGRKAAQAQRALRASCAEVARREVVAPVQAELDRYRRAVAAVRRAG